MRLFAFRFHEWLRASGVIPSYPFVSVELVLSAGGALLRSGRLRYLLPAAWLAQRDERFEVRGIRGPRPGVLLFGWNECSRKRLSCEKGPTGAARLSAPASTRAETLWRERLPPFPLPWGFWTALLIVWNSDAVHGGSIEGRQTSFLVLRALAACAPGCSFGRGGYRLRCSTHLHLRSLADHDLGCILIDDSQVVARRCWSWFFTDPCRCHPVSPRRHALCFARVSHPRGAAFARRRAPFLRWELGVLAATRGH